MEGTNWYLFKQEPTKFGDSLISVLAWVEEGYTGKRIELLRQR